MDLGLVTKLNKRNTGTARKMDDYVRLSNYDVIVIFPIMNSNNPLRISDLSSRSYPLYLRIEESHIIEYLFLALLTLLEIGSEVAWL